MAARLDIKHFDGTTFTDYSKEAEKFKRDTFSITIETDDFLYVGYPKQIDAIYAYMRTANLNTGMLTAEYWNGTDWAALDICDDTNMFIRSAFITWERQTDAELTTVDGLERIWVRFAVDTNTTAIDFEAINIIFSDDQDIMEKEPALLDTCFYPAGQSDYVQYHVAAKNKLISDLKRLGYFKYDANRNRQPINEWDVLRVDELKRASCYYAISQIYFNLSDDPEDQYWAKYRENLSKFDAEFNLGSLSIDINDNGTEEEHEKLPKKTTRWFR